MTITSNGSCVRSVGIYRVDKKVLATRNFRVGRIFGWCRSLLCHFNANERFVDILGGGKRGKTDLESKIVLRNIGRALDILLRRVRACTLHAAYAYKIRNRG